MTTGELVKLIRTQRGMSALDLAGDAGVSVSVIKRFEANEGGVSLGTAVKLADALDVPLDALCGRKKYRYSVYKSADYEQLKLQYEDIQQRYSTLLSRLKDFSDLISMEQLTHSVKRGSPEFRKMCARKGEQNGFSKMTEKDVVDIRLRKKGGEDKSRVLADYPQITKSGFNKIWLGETWKNVKI